MPSSVTELQPQNVADRPPRWSYLVCALMLLAAVLVLHREVLLGGMIYHLDDAADGYYPSRVAIWRAFREGHLPLWERGASAGWPLVADPYYGPFYPLAVIFYAFGVVRGLGLTIALHVLLAAVGMFLLVRRRGLDVGPACLAAVSLGFSSFMVCRIRHIIFPEGLAWLPWIFVGVEGYLADRRARSLVLAATATGLTVLSGALPLLPFFAMLAVVYVPLRLARGRTEENERWGAWRPLVGLSLALMCGGLLSMAQLVPTIAHLPFSPRAFGADLSFSSSYAWPDLRYLGTLVVPNLFGSEERSRWFGAYNHWEMAGYYAGLFPVLLAPLALWRGRRRPELVGLFAASLVGILLAFGTKGPLHAWFFRHVPLYAALRCPTRALVMALFVFPLLSAEGLAHLLDRLKRTNTMGGLLVALVFLVGGAVAALALFHDPRGIAESRLIARHAFAHFACVLGLGGAVLALGWTGILRASATALLLALVTLVELVALGRGYVQPKPADFAAGTERFAAVDWLLAQKPTDRFAPDARGPFRLHNLGMTYGIEGASGYDSVSVWRYVNFLRLLNTGVPYQTPLREDPAAMDVRRFDSPLVDLLNIRWVISPWLPAKGWLERFRPAPGARPHARYEPVWDPLLRVYENPHVLPRAFVVYDVEEPKDEAEETRALLRLDPRKSALVDRAPDPRPVGDSRQVTPARLVGTDRHHLVVEAEPSAPGLLVLSETFYPGWSALVDGKPVPLLRADYAFRGVALSAGRHIVEFRYRSRPAELGLLLSLLGLFLLGGLGFWGRRGEAPRRVL